MQSIVILIKVERGDLFLDAKFAQQFKKGVLEMVLLSIISKNSTYGYEIIATLGRLGSPVFENIKEGTLYPVLYRLEDAGFVESHLSSSDGGSRTKKYYVITEKGKAALKDMREYWRSCKSCVDIFMEADENE